MLLAQPIPAGVLGNLECVRQTSRNRGSPLTERQIISRLPAETVNQVRMAARVWRPQNIALAYMFLDVGHTTRTLEII